MSTIYLFFNMSLRNDNVLPTCSRFSFIINTSIEGVGHVIELALDITTLLLRVGPLEKCIPFTERLITYTESVAIVYLLLTTLRNHRRPHFLSVIAVIAALINQGHADTKHYTLLLLGNTVNYELSS